MLAENYRCLYLNSPPMVAGMSSYLAAKGVNVAQEVSKGSVVLSSDRTQLSDGGFDVEQMVGKLKEAVGQALRDGYKGLWATGDMSWEFGPERNFQKLLRYERRLEQLFEEEPALCGVCQYHSDLLPQEVLRQGLMTHRAVFGDERSRGSNPHYRETGPAPGETLFNEELDEAIARLRAGPRK